MPKTVSFTAEFKTSSTTGVQIAWSPGSPFHFSSNYTQSATASYGVGDALVTFHFKDRGAGFLKEIVEAGMGGLDMSYNVKGTP